MCARQRLVSQERLPVTGRLEIRRSARHGETDPRRSLRSPGASEPFIGWFAQGVPAASDLP
jgi:hypothetical protein